MKSMKTNATSISVSFTQTHSLTLPKHTQTALLRVNTHNCPSLSHSSTFTLCLFENPLNNLDLLGSAKTHGGRSYDVTGVIGQDCDAYTARLPVAFEQTPTLFMLTYWSSYSIVEKKRHRSQKHIIDHFLIICQVKYLNVVMFMQ